MFSDVPSQRMDRTLDRIPSVGRNVKFRTIVVSSETIVIPSEARNLLGCMGDEDSAPGRVGPIEKPGWLTRLLSAFHMKLDPYITNARASNSC